MAEVKLKDIAQAAGVSTVTVSNALSGKRGVSIDVREKIEKIARNMGYDFPDMRKRRGLSHRSDCFRNVYGNGNFFLLGHVSADCVCCVQKSESDDAGDSGYRYAETG